MRIGVFLPNWVGDVVMATPALRSLRSFVGSDGRLVGIMRPYVAEVLAGTTWLDDQIIYDKPSSRWKVASREVYQTIRAARLDRVVLLPNSLSTAWMAWRSGVRQRFGYRNGRAWLLTHPVVQPLAEDGHWVATIEGYLHLVEASGCERASPQLELGTTRADEQSADAVWQELRLPPGERVVAFNSGGAFGEAKQWPAEYFAELARRIVAGGQYSVLINCGPAERDVARKIVALANDPRVVSLANVDRIPVGLTKACIRRSRLLVTTDSGPRYFGIAFGRPVVTLFGPTDPLRTETHYEAESCVSLALDCQPCMARTCPLGHHRCMRELTVDRVFEAVGERLAANSKDWAA